METPGTTSVDVDVAALLTGVAAGDRDAFAELYDATARRAFGLALRVTGSAQAAEDVVQEAYLQVWRSAGDKSHEHGSATAWILTIVHRRAVDAVRAQTARERRERATGQREPRSALLVDDAGTEAERRALRRGVADCLGGLTDLQRESIALAYLDGLTYREVAEHLGAPLPTVKARIRGAMGSLRTCLGAWR